MRIAIVHPTFSLGGAGAIAAWSIEALKADHELAFVTTEDVSVAAMNRFFGTDIQDTEIELRKVPNPLGGLGNGFLMKLALTQRYYKRHHDEFDLALATRCEMDLGQFGIQYVACPIWNDRMLKELGQLPSEGIHQWPLGRKLYQALAQRVGRHNESRMMRSLTLADSDWTGQWVKKLYGVEPRTVYPPVLNDYPVVPWADKEEGFVCIGSVTPGKRVLDAIQIIEAVRDKDYPSIHLHIIGPPDDVKYGQAIDEACQQNAEWLSWQKKPSRQELAQLVASHKYGIHGMPNEHFGIVVAEMAKAGCIPFVPNSGGQVEIVADSRVLYSSIPDAVDKIDRVLGDDCLQSELRSHLEMQGTLFSVDSFMQSIQQAVAEACP